jgi:geranylgeranyl pyrophosphate synthase
MQQPGTQSLERAQSLMRHLCPNPTAAGGSPAPAAPASLQTIETVLKEHRPLIDAALEKWMPRKFDQQKMEWIFGKARYAYDADSITKALSVPIWDILDRGGKRWRPTLLILVAEALGAKLDDVIDFVAVCELVHNGSLVVDDIEDGSQLRRGKPCLHRIFPLDVAVNAGNAMYFLPLAVLRDKRGKLSERVLNSCYEVYSQEMINLHAGQGLDIGWHNGYGDPTVDEYLQMCAYKTGTLARMSAKISALVSGAKPKQVAAFGRFAEAIGVAFQIQDDLLNISGDKYVGHEFGEDIQEGKRTLMVIHSLKAATPTAAARLKEILAMHTTDEKLIREAIAILRSTNSLDFAKGKARELISAAWKDIEPSLRNNAAKGKLKAFADYLVDREF